MSDTENKKPELDAARKKWEDTILKKTLSRSPERQGEFDTLSGIKIERFYAPGDIEGFDYERDLGFPGQYPFTRGVQPTMY